MNLKTYFIFLLFVSSSLLANQKFYVDLNLSDANQEISENHILVYDQDFKEITQDSTIELNTNANIDTTAFMGHIDTDLSLIHI